MADINQAVGRAGNARPLRLSEDPRPRSHMKWEEGKPEQEDAAFRIRRAPIVIHPFIHPWRKTCGHTVQKIAMAVPGYLSSLLSSFSTREMTTHLRKKLPRLQCGAVRMSR